MWVFWNERKGRIFEDKEKKLPSIILDVQELMFGYQEGMLYFVASISMMSLWSGMTVA